MSFPVTPLTGRLILLVYAVLRIGILNFDLEDVDNRDAYHNKHKDCDPLKGLLRLYLMVQMIDSLAELIDGSMKMLLADGRRLFCAVVRNAACSHCHHTGLGEVI